MWQAPHIKNKKITFTLEETPGSKVKRIDNPAHPKHGRTGGQARVAHIYTTRPRKALTNCSREQEKDAGRHDDNQLEVFCATLDTVLKQRYTLLKYVWLSMFA